MDDTKLIELAGLASGESYDNENNPLLRDDLALRLAVRLEISIEFSYCMDDAPIIWCRTHYGYEEQAANFPDPYAATRRAIVRAAAEVAKGNMTQDEFILTFPGRFEDETVDNAAASSNNTA